MIPIRYNLRSLVVRRTTSLMTALGVGLVVMILLIVLGFVAGLRRTMLLAGNANNFVVLSRGVTSEPGSYITLEQYEVIKTRPEIALDSEGQALVSPEMVTGFNPSPDSPGGQFTFMRGVYPQAFKVHRNMKVVAGRWFEKGANELIVGRKLAARFPNLNPPNEFRFGRRVWKIVGVFADDDSARESEVWSDLDILRQDIRYAQGFGALHVVLRPAMADSLNKALASDARLRVDAISEEQFYADQAKFADQLRALGMAVAIVLGVGAIFGGMNTMYAAVARRGKEVGVLRALGFGRGNILVSFLTESVILAAAGGLAGEVLGVLTIFATGLNHKLMNVGLFIFSFRMTPGTFLAGLIAAAIIGALGGILPAWRAARIGVIDSLRTT